EGREEGLKQGLEQGMKQGREEGIEEGIKKIALSCLKRNLSLEFIEDLTGLTKEKISTLRDIKRDE
ncbi:MAG: hypothetical protein LBJ57_04180, partial [Prevotellaceae bacterium]|nr:hypothetical protein [Prevotellaceae bacterium]